MEFKELARRAYDIKEAYRLLNKAKGEKDWTAAEYAQGFVGDVGDLVKLIMAHEGYRTIANADQKLAHELADCLWSVIVLADELKIDLESEFLSTMSALEDKIQKMT